MLNKNRNNAVVKKKKQKNINIIHLAGADN